MFSSAYLDEKREVVEQYLKRLLKRRFSTRDGKAVKLSESVAYSLLAGGKRIRPLITLAIIESYRPLDEQAVSLACTTELLHTASLMLDDLPSMDNAELRRGRKTNHRVFGESTTILAAMALWSEAIRLMATIENIEINDIVRETAESVGQKGLVRGQFLDLDSFHTPQTAADLEECAYLKTAILFKNAARIAALLVSAPAGEQAILENFGREFGLIYQIRDDLLDATELGKDTGIDARNGRTTYITLLGEAGTKQLIKEKIRSVLAELDKLPFRSEHLSALVCDLEVQ